MRISCSIFQTQQSHFYCCTQKPSLGHSRRCRHAWSPRTGLARRLISSRIPARMMTGTTFSFLDTLASECFCATDLVTLTSRFEYAERLLSLIGEGGDEEVSSDGKWGKWPAWKKQIREEID